MEREELAAALIYQVGALSGFLDAEGMELSHVKPHGALYGRGGARSGGGRRRSPTRRRCSACR